MNLLVLAAGMGSRFGGLKQIEPVGPNGEFILDYSINDAIKAGFKKVVFVIKKENLELFKSTIGKRLEKVIEVDYAFQDIKDVPIEVPDDRVKPWGTVQAILCAKDKIDNNFAIINADDFYGRDAYLKAYELLKDLNQGNNYGAVLYEASSTLSENGKVKRGVCKTKDGYIQEIIESNVYEKDNVLMCEPLDNSESFVTDLQSLVSMNIFLFNKSIFELLEKSFNDFLVDDGDIKTKEYVISTLVDEKIKTNEIKIRYVSTNAKWYGITYREDLPLLKKGINELINLGEYKDNLWG